jgi:putative transposase
MQLRYRYRLQPTRGQRQILARAFGCARVVFNDGLRMREQARLLGENYVSNGEVQRVVITAAKGTEERAWLAEVSSVALVQSVNDLHRAYRNFFDSLSGHRRGRVVGAPRFKSKRGPQSIRLTRNGFRVRPNGRLDLAKVGEVPVVWSRELPSEPSSVTITLDAAGRYWASFVVEVADRQPPVSDRWIGIDLGLTHFAITSTGEKFDNPRWLRSKQRYLARLQRALARKKKGSNNRKKAVRKVASLHAKVADARRDYLHKLSTRLIRDNQAVYVEDLCVSGLARTKMARSVYDAGWSMFVNMLDYKARLNGRTFGKVDRFLATSQICSDCGRRDGPKGLSVRTWTCHGCGTVLDRDINAAKNVLAAGRAESLNACGAEVKPLLAVAPGVEAGTRRSAA